MRRLSLLESIAGSYSAEILLALCRSPLATELLEPCTAVCLAHRHRLSLLGLTHLLEYLARSTDLLRKEGDHYQLRATPASLAAIRYQLEKFRGAYGPAVSACLDSLRDEKLGRDRVDREALASAFVAMGDSVNGEALQAIQEAGIGFLLDLGCGPASLLRELALRNHRFIGIGIDENAAMCRAARRRLRELRVEKRVTIIHGDATAGALSRISFGRKTRVEALHGGSFLNAFFARGEAGVIAVLKDLAGLFPGRSAWFVDYYGGRSSAVNMLQDVAQVVSGQGVPAATRTAWSRIYRAAGCLVVSLKDYRSGPTEWFLHHVVLRK
ncbi:MAG TPA: class I SAM-dependent methyltransferase [Bryobacteraceae bacterium]